MTKLEEKKKKKTQENVMSSKEQKPELKYPANHQAYTFEKLSQSVILKIIE